jgi:hypothetical protein
MWAYLFRDIIGNFGASVYLESCKRRIQAKCENDSEVY